MQVVLGAEIHVRLEPKIRRVVPSLGLQYFFDSVMRKRQMVFGVGLHLAQGN